MLSHFAGEVSTPHPTFCPNFLSIRIGTYVALCKQRRVLAGRLAGGGIPMNSPDMNALHNDRASHVTRRTFCNSLLLTTGVVLVAPSVVGNSAAAQESTIAYPPRKIDGADTLLPGASLYFDYPTRNDPAVLVRSAEGEFRAYSRKCSHAGCSVEVDAPRRCLSCPCHRGAYDMRYGYVMFGPPRRPLDEIVLQVRAGGQVWAIGKSFGRNAELITQEVRKP